MPFLKNTKTNKRTSALSNVSAKKRYLVFSRKRVSKTQKQDFFKELNSRYGIRIKPTNALTAVAGILIGYFGRNAALELFRQKGFENKTHVSVNIGKDDIATKNNATRKTNNTAVQTNNATINTNVAQTDNAKINTDDAQKRNTDDAQIRNNATTRKKPTYKENLKQLSKRNLNGSDDSYWEKDDGGDKTYDTHYGGSDCPKQFKNWCPLKFPYYCGRGSKSPGWCVEREANCDLREQKIEGAPAYYYSRAFREANVKEGNDLNRLYVQERRSKTAEKLQKLEYRINEDKKKSHAIHRKKGLPFKSTFDQQKEQLFTYLNKNNNFPPEDHHLHNWFIKQKGRIAATRNKYKKDDLTELKIKASGDAQEEIYEALTKQNRNDTEEKKKAKQVIKKHLDNFLKDNTKNIEKERREALKEKNDEKKIQIQKERELRMKESDERKTAHREEKNIKKKARNEQIQNVETLKEQQKQNKKQMEKHQKDNAEKKNKQQLKEKQDKKKRLKKAAMEKQRIQKLKQGTTQLNDYLNRRQ